MIYDMIVYIYMETVVSGLFRNSSVLKSFHSNILTVTISY